MHAEDLRRGITDTKIMMAMHMEQMGSAYIHPVVGVCVCECVCVCVRVCMF